MRDDEDYKSNENKNLRRNKLRADKNYKQQEREARNETRRILRSSNLYKAGEKEKKKLSGRRNLDELISQFHEKVSRGPVYVCSCCDQLWYRHSVSCISNMQEKVSCSIIEIYLQRGAKSVQMAGNGYAIHIFHIWKRKSVHLLRL